MSRGWSLWTFLVPGVVAAAPNPWAPQPGPMPTQGKPGPALEISGNPAVPVLPAIPSFLIPSSASGLHNPLELRVGGERLRGTRVRVGGYITWIYDCATALADLDQTHARTQELIDPTGEHPRPAGRVVGVPTPLDFVSLVDRDPALCERPKFTLGDAADTPPDRSLWVVDVPRHPYRVERQHLSAKQLASWPAVPRLAVGDHVEVTGTFAVRSPHNEVNSDGLIVYEAIKPAANTGPSTTPTALPEVKLPPAPKLTAPVRLALPATAGDSIRHANAGNRAYASQQYDTAIAEFEAAVRAWSGNDTAWYGLAGSRSWRGNYRAAIEAAERSVALVPEQAMYWLLLGRLRYEATIAEATDRAARDQGRRADQVTIDRSTLDFAPALQALFVAARLENKLWRAHYHIGRILRDRGDAKAAAEQLTCAIALHAWEAGPYVALSELYLRWRYLDEALAIAEVGSAAVPSSAAIWFDLGMAHDDRDEPGPAIEAYTRALELRPEFAQARFRRGRAYFRQHGFVQARRDLEQFVNAGGTSFEIEQARSMLAGMKR